MRITVLSILALLLSTSLIQTGNGLLSTLLPIRAGIELFSELSVGIMGSSFYLGLVAGCYFGVWVVKRVGHIRSFTAFTAIASVCALLYVMDINEYVWWLVRGLTGLCFAGMQMIIESWLNERASNANRGKILSFYTLINLSLIILGQQIIQLASPSEFVLFMVASVLLSLAVIPVAITTSPSPVRPKNVKLRIMWLYKQSPASVLGSIGVGLATGAFWTMGPLFALKYGLTIPQIDTLMSISVFGGVIALWPIGWISDIVDRRLMIVVTSLIAAIAALLIATHLVKAVVFTYVMIGLFGGFCFPLYSICLAHANDLTDTPDMVSVSGGLLLPYSMGAVVGPLIASVLMNAYSYYMLFYFTATIHIILALIIVWRMKVTPAIQSTDKDRFIALPKTSPTVSELDPRTH
jgi:MFS family permease